MLKTRHKSSEIVSWEDIRIRASRLGIPAWQLAEELVVHDAEGRLILKILDNK